MKLWMKLGLAMVLLAVLPLTLLNRYATSTFHHFTRQEQEERMIQSARLVAWLFTQDEAASVREDLLRDHARHTGQHLRFYDAAGTLLFETGEVAGLEFGEQEDVMGALETGRYQARWWLKPDRSRLFYFSSLPVRDPEGTLLGVAQVAAHTDKITQAIVRLHNQQRASVGWVAAGSLGMVTLFTWLLTRRLRRLGHAAARFPATGNVDAFSLSGSDEVSDLSRGFHQMAVDLKAQREHNQEFVLTTLHELRTPLTAMHGAADILSTRESLSPDDRRRFASNIVHQSERLLTLVGELRSLTSLEVDLPLESLQKQPVGPLTLETIDRLRPGVQVPVTAEGGDHIETVRVNPGRFEQILTNLLDNAQRYHPENTPVVVKVSVLKGRAEVAVLDEGQGIAEEDPLRIFERYYTTVPRDQREAYGRGLGLAVVRKIVEHWGGEVFAENLPEGGARVGLRLPVYDGPE